MLVNHAKKQGVHLPVQVRMAMIYESEMAAQERLNAIFGAPIEVERDGDGFKIKTDLDLGELFNEIGVEP